jgi:ATP-dependent Lon protease
MPGVVGLAWTPAGGILHQARILGGLKLTGSLGDVMRESAEAARSWLRTQAPLLAIDEKAFESSDVHLHVPSGGVPKDGPSAGVAMVTSLASLLTGRLARPFVAMTGEITLRGRCCRWAGSRRRCSPPSAPGSAKSCCRNATAATWTKFRST